MESLGDKLNFYLGAVVAWSVFFLFVNYNVELPAKLGKRKIDDVKNRIVSIAHGLFCVVFTAYHIYTDNPQYAEPATAIQHIIILTSCAYFTYDFFACVVYGLADLGLILHHGMCLAGMVSCVMMNNCTTGLVGLFFAELSNCPMHVRAILRTLKMRYTKLYELCECCYMVIYAVARGIFCTFLVISSTPVSEVPILIRITCTGLWIQSLYYIYEMSGIIKRKLKHHKERVNKKISYHWFSDNARLKELSYYKNEGSDKIF